MFIKNSVERDTAKEELFAECEVLYEEKSFSSSLKVKQDTDGARYLQLPPPSASIELFLLNYTFLVFLSHYIRHWSHTNISCKGAVEMTDFCSPQPTLYKDP